MKTKILAVLTAVVLSASGCLTQHAFQAKDPLVSYFAALADYNGAKRIALAYVELPSTTKGEADAVVRVVTRGDEAVDKTEALRAACETSATEEANATVPDVGAELTADETANAFEAAKSVAFAACLPSSKLEATGRVLQAIAAELRKHAATQED